MTKALLITTAAIMAMVIGQELARGVAGRAKAVQVTVELVTRDARIDCAHTQEGCRVR